MSEVWPLGDFSGGGSILLIRSRIRCKFGVMYAWQLSFGSSLRLARGGHIVERRWHRQDVAAKRCKVIVLASASHSGVRFG